MLSLKLKGRESIEDKMTRFPPCLPRYTGSYANLAHYDDCVVPFQELDAELPDTPANALRFYDTFVGNLQDYMTERGYLELELERIQPTMAHGQRPRENELNPIIITRDGSLRYQNKDDGTKYDVRLGDLAEVARLFFYDRESDFSSIGDSEDGNLPIGWIDDIILGILDNCPQIKEDFPDARLTYTPPKLK